MLPGRHYYARLFPQEKMGAGLAEETDRYLEACELAQIFRELFEYEIAGK